VPEDLESKILLKRLRQDAAQSFKRIYRNNTSGLVPEDLESKILL
ncbi:MAG: hypothetical protein PWR06_1661, partial [Thermoanaerobacteraceae bacterium]|nr:hypothetical protein [Thermoanaerobacteraceae bacterium]